MPILKNCSISLILVDIDEASVGHFGSIDTIDLIISPHSASRFHLASNLKVCFCDLKPSLVGELDQQGFMVRGKCC
jgi:hypothetical protein